MNQGTWRILKQEKPLNGYNVVRGTSKTNVEFLCEADNPTKAQLIADAVNEKEDRERHIQSDS